MYNRFHLQHPVQSTRSCVTEYWLYTKFVLIDKNNTTNSDIGPKKKQYLEQFDNTFGRKIEDIIEDNGKEIYYCHDKQSSIDRIFDSKSWNYDSIGVYDAKNHTFKVTGNLTGVFPSGR